MATPAVLKKPTKKKKKHTGVLLTKLALSLEKSKGGGVISLLVKLLDGKTITVGADTFTLADFASEWKAGGKDAVEGDWRDSANTRTGGQAPIASYDPAYSEVVGNDGDDQYEIEIRSGKHEWIPTNMLAYVVENAVHHQDAGGAQKWLSMAEALRTQTRLVVLKPTTTANITGHVAAVYKQKPTNTLEYVQLTKGQAGFHDELRTILKANLSPTRSNPDNFRTELTAFIQKRFWLGEAIPGINDSDPCPYYFNSGASEFTSWGPTMGDMRKRLSDGWAIEHQIMVNAFASILAIPNSNIAYGHSARFLMQGGAYDGDEGMSGMDEDDSMSN